MTVVRPSTQEWQRQKLGPSIVREFRWMCVHLVPVAQAFANMFDALVEIMNDPAWQSIMEQFADLTEDEDEL